MTRRATNDASTITGEITMPFENYSDYDALGLADLVRRREVSPTELVDSAISAIEKLNPDLNCVVQPLRDHAISEIKRGLPQGPFLSLIHI